MPGQVCRCTEYLPRQVPVPLPIPDTVRWHSRYLHHHRRSSLLVRAHGWYLSIVLNLPPPTATTSATATSTATATATVHPTRPTRPSLWDSAGIWRVCLCGTVRTGRYISSYVIRRSRGSRHLAPVPALQVHALPGPHNAASPSHTRTYTLIYTLPTTTHLLCIHPAFAFFLICIDDNRLLVLSICEVCKTKLGVGLVCVCVYTNIIVLYLYLPPPLPPLDLSLFVSYEDHNHQLHQHIYNYLPLPPPNTSSCR